MNRAERRRLERAVTPVNQLPAEHHYLLHELDDDAICIHCGFDAAEAWHLRHSIPPQARMPREFWEVYCERRTA